MENEQKYQKFQEEDQEKEANENKNKILLKIKTLDGQNREVYADKQHTILQFKKEVFEQEMSENKVIKLIYRGRLLKDDENIEIIGFPQGSFLHASITVDQSLQQQKQQDEQTNNNQNQQSNSDQVAINMENTENSANNNNNQDQENGSQQQQNQQSLNQQQIVQFVNYLQQERQNIQQQSQSQQQAGENSQQTQQQDDNLGVRGEVNRGTQLDIVAGFILGFSFALPGILFVFFCNFSQKARLGAFMGFSVRLLYTIIFKNHREYNQKQDDDSGHINSSSNGTQDTFNSDGSSDENPNVPPSSGGRMLMEHLFGGLI